MKIHEYQARNLFVQYGIPVANGGVSDTVEGAKAITAKIGYQGTGVSKSRLSGY